MPVVNWQQPWPSERPSKSVLKSSDHGGNTMKLSNQVLRSRSVGPLNAAEYLDLSELGLVSLGRLSSCPKVTSLILRGNHLQDASGLDSCPQLWHLDLGNNQLRSVEGLSRFLALGTLVLSNNQLTWSSLSHLRNMHILSLSLHGNPQLEKDPYYRIHVIDCLPNVWMLDGRIVTSAERIQVRQFFNDSALRDRPVRRKLKKDSFVPSTLKKIEIDGIFGEKAVKMMTTFPKNAVLNVETDWKRLQYLSTTLQEDITLEWQYTLRKPAGLDLSQKPGLLTDLFEARSADREKCNMVLLMLVASLDFVLPTHLVRDTLDTGKLLTLGSVQTMDLFLLPRLLRCKVVSLLVSAVKVDREQSEDGGLYTKLYLCLYHMVSELTRLSETSASALHTSPDSKLAIQLQDYKCLLATEVVQLMCIVPSFFDYLDRDIGVMNLVRIATADPDINEKLLQISKTKEDETSQNGLFKEMADFLLLKVQEQLQNLTNKSAVMNPCDRILVKSSALPMKGENTPVCKADYLVRGVGSPDDDPPAVNPRKTSAKVRTKFPHLGDRMLLGPQTIGKIISLPQPTMALVIIDAVPVASGAVEHKQKESENHYTYVNMDQLEWDTTPNLWKPKGTVGDNGKSYSDYERFTLQAAEDFNRESMTTGMADDSFRPSTPEAIMGSDLQALQASTAPLIYTPTPRQHVFVPTEHTSNKPKTRRPQRPLSSVYKERLKLTLDLSRRVQSAGSRRPFAVTFGAKSSTPKNPKVSNLQLDSVTGLKLDTRGMSSRDKEGGLAGEVYSSRRASSSFTLSSDSRPPLQDSSAAQERNVGSNEEMLSSRSSRPAAQSTPKKVERHATVERREEGKENKPPPGDATAEVNPLSGPEASNSTKEERQMPTEASPAATREEEKPEEVYSTFSHEELTTRSDTGMRFRERTVPEHVNKEKLDEQADPSDPANGIFLTAVNESPSTVAQSYAGHQLAGRNRPVSAIERQRVIGNGKAGENVYHSDFQQQRIDAWKQATRPASQPKMSTMQSTTPPPPQPPSSPIPHEVPAGTSTLTHDNSMDTISIASLPPRRSRADPTNIIYRRMPRANMWLAGGRDLFYEGLKKRPKSGHTPGWKEGLPDSMKPRPRSAAGRLHRHTKTPTMQSPATKDRSLLHGTMLNDLADFADAHRHHSYTGSGRSSRSSRRYNSQRSLYDEDPLPGPMPDNVYSPLKVVSYQRPAGYLSNGCLPCLYEDYFDELDFESQYTPTCNTPTTD